MALQGITPAFKTGCLRSISQDQDQHTKYFSRSRSAYEVFLFLCFGHTVCPHLNMADAFVDFVDIADYVALGNAVQNLRLDLKIFNCLFCAYPRFSLIRLK